MKIRISKINGWRDGIELILAFWLVISPFAVGFITSSAASGTAFIIGSLIMLFSFLGMEEEQPWEEWTTLALALILLLSPWVFGYAAMVAATVNVLVVGGLLVLLTIMTMKHEYDERHAHQ